MRKQLKSVSAFVFMFMVCIASCSLPACDGQKYTLTVNNADYLYEEPATYSYRAGERVTLKVKHLPNVDVYGYINSCLNEPLVQVQIIGEDFYTYAFEMPASDTRFIIETSEFFGEPLLTGFYLTFYSAFTADGKEQIEGLNQPLDDKDAVAVYYCNQYDREHDLNYFTVNYGADVFAEGKIAEKTEAGIGLSKLEMEETLYFTYELVNCYARVEWVYCDEATKTVSATGNGYHCLQKIASSSTRNNCNLSTTRYTASGEPYEKTFDSRVTVNFEYIDYLTGVKVLEYNQDNELIDSIAYEKGTERSDVLNVAENCAYAVIEEEYTVMQGDDMGEKHVERTLVQKSTTGGVKTLKYPRGDGLIAPVFLHIKW